MVSKSDLYEATVIDAEELSVTQPKRIWSRHRTSDHWTVVCTCSVTEAEELVGDANKKDSIRCYAAFDLDANPNCKETASHLH